MNQEVENKETIYNISQLENKETENKQSIANKDFKTSLSVLKNNYSYERDFNLMLGSVLNETELKLIKGITESFKDYKLLKQLELNKHLYKLNRNFYFKFNDLERQYNQIVTNETELNKTNNTYLIKWDLKEIRNNKRQLINNLRNMIKDYKNNLDIKRKQQFLKSISLNQYKKMLFYKVDFNIKKRNHIKNKTYDLFFKYTNQKENRIFKVKLQKLKNVLLHIKQHYNRNNRITKTGYYKQIEILTKWFLRYNKNNRNIKFNGIMIYLFAQHFELISLNDNTLKRINKVLEYINTNKKPIGINRNKEIIFKDSTLLKTNINKDLFYITDSNTEYKTTNTEIEFKELKEINNKEIKESNRINLLFKNRIKLLLNTETEVYNINNFNDSLKPLKEIIKYKNNYFYKLDSGIYQEIEINNNNNNKIKDYFITEKQNPLIKELIHNKKETWDIYTDNGTYITTYEIKPNFKTNMNLILESKEKDIFGNKITTITDFKTWDKTK